MIRLERVSKEWPEFALKEVSLEVDDDEYFVILGPTGSGKTLLLELLAGFHSLDSGTIWMDGKDLASLPPEERNLGFVYQDYMLFPHMTVRENISYGLRIRKAEDLDDVVEEAARSVRVEDLMERKPYTLSGGEQQRVALARALVLSPRVLLLDEPFGGLDQQTTVSLRRLLKDLHNEYGGTVIHVTHDQEEAVIVGDRVGVLQEGQLVQVGSPEEVMRKPASRFVAQFMGTGNIFHGTAEQDGDTSSIRVDGREIHSTAKIEGSVTVTVRPEDIILAEDQFRSSARNCFQGEIAELIDRGIFYEAKIDAGIPLVVFITRQSIENLDMSVGKKIFVMFKASAVNVFKD